MKVGYIVVTPTLCQGDTISWSQIISSENETVPYIFESEVDAYKEIADSMVICLEQFINDERELEDTDFCSMDYVAKYTEDDEGDITVSEIEGGNIILTTTLEKWRRER